MNEQNIPIDINTGKLLDWLVSRRHVNKDWQNSVLKIREKINNAIQDMPAHEGVIKLLSRQHINYFHCLKIIEILKETEADTKNLFGRYGSQRMKDWKDIVQSYQQDGLYLAEAAQVLIRNVNYEIPSLRKQIVKFEQVQADCEKKIKDYTKNETLMINEFNSTCKQLGICGEKIKVELVQLLDELPHIYDEAFEKIKSLQNAVDFYTGFVKFNSGQENNSDVLPMLKYLIAHGNTTTYEYMYGEKPVSIELSEIKPTENVKQINGIDFGDHFITTDFEDTNAISGDVSINWDNSNSEDDFEIVNPENVNSNLEESGIVVENSVLDGIARGNDALTILDNPKTRDEVLNGLIELQAFLNMRLFEISNESDLLTMSQMQDAPTILQMQTLETITAVNDFVQIALNELTNKRTQHLHNIKHSPKYVDMLTSSLKQKLAAVDRLRASKIKLEEKINDARIHIQNVKPIINIIVENTKILQGQIEEDISRRYKGRPTHIVGGINML